MKSTCRKRQHKEKHMRKLVVTGIATISLTLMLSGCSSLKKEMQTAMQNNTDIHLSVEQSSSDVTRGSIEWIELDQLSNHKNIRKVWDDKLNIIRFDANSKNGCIFVDTDGNWAGNNTMYNAFQNKNFVLEYWRDGKIKSALAQAAMSEYSDISNESTGIIASANTYFNILPDNADETSGMLNYLTRAEVLAALYRGQNEVQLLEEDTAFTNAVGETQYNIYAQNLEPYSYMDIASQSLNKNTYNSTMTRAEAIYALVKLLYNDEYESLTGNETGLSDCKNAGNVADKQGFTNGYAYKTFELEYCLQNKDKGVCEPLYKALIVAYNHGLIDRESRWYDGIRGGELIKMMIAAYDNVYDDNNFLANAKVGANAGESLYVKNEVEDVPIIENAIETSGVVVQKVKDIADIDSLIKVYGDEINMTEEEIVEAKQIAEGFTIEAYDKYMLVDFCSHLNVRMGPSTDYKIRSSISKGTQVHIVGLVHEVGWYRVIADGKISYQRGVYFSDLEGADTSNIVFEYEDGVSSSSAVKSDSKTEDGAGETEESGEAGDNSSEQETLEDSTQTTESIF